MPRRSLRWIIQIFLLLAFGLAACQPQSFDVPVTRVVTEVQTVRETVVVTAPVTQTPVSAFSQPHPLLGDLRIRQGIAYCLNRDNLIGAVYPFLDQKSALAMESFVPAMHWAYHAANAQYPYDPERGQALFEEAGWSLPQGAVYRVNASGAEMTVRFTLSNTPFAQTWAAAFEKDMEHCGLRVLRFHVPSSWWLGENTGLARRDFELGSFAWVTHSDPNGRSAYGCDQIPSAANDWHGQNYMGWCNAAADEALRAASQTPSRAEQIQNYALVQEELAKELPTLPLFSRAEILAASPVLTNFSPAPNERFYTWNIQQWESSKETVVIGLLREPGALFPLDANDFSAQLVNNLLYGQGYTTRNYDYQPLLYQALPSLDNGGVSSADVSVNVGSTVVDVTGQAVRLVAGVRVLNAEGQVVEFDGSGPLMMKQLFVTSAYLNDIKYSDDSSLTKGDIELTDKVACSTDAGLPVSQACTWLAHATYNDDLSVSYALWPGAQPTDYTLFLANQLNRGGPYPSERKVDDDRLLVDVPTKDWANLSVVTQRPLGIGPYVLSSWDKGKQMTFEANSHFILGAPKIKRLQIVFLVDTTQAISKLLAGEVDVLGSEVLGTGPELQALATLAKAGRVKLYVQPGAVWEHLDFALWKP